MSKNPLQELLNKLYWSVDINKRDYEIIIRDPLEATGEKSIPFSHIFKIDRFGIDVLGGDYIPLHKIIAIKKSGQIIWAIC